jgi:hypothetical protein
LNRLRIAHTNHSRELGASAIHPIVGLPRFCIVSHLAYQKLTPLRVIDGSVERSPTSPAPARPKRSRRKLIALLAAIAIVVAAFATWEILRPRSIAEVLSMEHLKAGDNIVVQGTITSIAQERTGLGTRVILQLDGNRFCGDSEPWSGSVLGAPNTSYAVGASYQTTLHLQSFSVNGDSAVWAPELVCPFPALHRSIGVVIDAVSQVRNLWLVYNGTDASAWSHYEIHAKNATGYQLDRVPAVLLKSLPFKGAGNVIDSANHWKSVADLFYLSVSAAIGAESPQGFSVADQMTSLALPASVNGTLRFVDTDSNGLVNAGDRIDIRPSATGASNGWNSYMIRIGNWSIGAPAYGSAVHVFLVGPGGVIDALPGAATITASSVGASRP